MKLFSEDLGKIRSDEELEALKQRFPDYDAGYLCQAAYGLREKDKAWMEGLWQEYEPYADEHFLIDFRRQFTQRSWELYLGVTFLNRSFTLGPHNNAGPDFDVRNDVGKRLFWAEAIAVTKGEGVDRVPDMLYGGVMDVPEESMMLRLTSAIKKKFEKYLSDLKKGIIGKNDPYIIAIDRSELQHVDASAPLVLKVLYGIGHLTITFALGDEGHKPTGSFYSELSELPKQSGKSVPTQFFRTPEYAGVSAVIYTNNGILSHPRVPGEMGEDFFVAHNPYAKNPVPHHLLPFGMEYIVQGDTVTPIRDRKDYKSPDPFDYLYDE